MSDLPQQPIEMILLRQLAEHLAIPMWVIDGEGDLVFFNEAAEPTLGVRADDVDQMPFEAWTTAFAPDRGGRPAAGQGPPRRDAPARFAPDHRRRRDRPPDRDHGLPPDRRPRGRDGLGDHVLGVHRAVRARLWGTRGSVASAGPQTARYGGNTACVEVRSEDGTLLVLDAGTGIQRLGNELETDLHRIDILLTHLHMDHIQGLGFFAPIFRRGCEIHVWGPPSPTQHLRARLTRYLSPPLFPIRLRDLRAEFEFHDAPQGLFTIGPFTIQADEVIHPGATLGYRVSENGRSLAYLSDHEPALAADGNRGPSWISGMRVARHADVLIHDAQYTQAEREERLGWGHSSVLEAIEFAQTAEVRQLVMFHHDPTRTDHQMDLLVAEAEALADGLPVTAAREGDVLVL
jgi:phosphoribosyl 1,2-cyclic phosphodiesterase